jgi:hypothetical protein
MEDQEHKLKREVFDPKKLLPQNIILKSVDSHPYRIGLSLFQTNESVRRKGLYIRVYLSYDIRHISTLF